MGKKRKQQYKGKVLFNEKSPLQVVSEASTASGNESNDVARAHVVADQSEKVQTELMADAGNVTPKSEVVSKEDIVPKEDVVPKKNDVCSNENEQNEASPQEQDFMRLLKLQEELLTKYDEIHDAIEKASHDLSCHEKALANAILKDEEFIKHFGTLKFNVCMSKESQDVIQKIFQNMSKRYANWVVSVTNREIARLQKVIGDERDAIDVVRLRWWPHGYILLGVFSLMLCIILALAVHLH